MNYAVASAVNFATLLLGILIGALLFPHVEKRVQAEQSSAQSTTVPQVEVGKTVDFNGQKITGISPAISAGGAAFYTLLSHRIQSDQMVVNGYDLLALQQGELNLLQRFVPKTEIDNLILQSRATDMFTVGAPPQAKPATSPQK